MLLYLAPLPFQSHCSACGGPETPGRRQGSREPGEPQAKRRRAMGDSSTESALVKWRRCCFVNSDIATCGTSVTKRRASYALTYAERGQPLPAVAGHPMYGGPKRHG
jgi:hypothetical protein